jgi:branched-chain amino acid transport system ATP-binding protein
MSELMRVEGLSKQFGGVAAIDALSFSIRPGSIHSIIGPNGAGKTTLFNLVTGLYTPSAGSIHFNGEDVTGLASHRLAAKGMGRTFQNLQLFHRMTALENVMVGRHLHEDRSVLKHMLRLPGIGSNERATRRRAEELLEFVELGDYRDVEASAMPYGALKRLEIARALAAEPKLLMLDEPAAGLNATETEAIDQLINQVAREGVTVVLVEHDMKLVMGISNHILVLDHGSKLAEGTAEEVSANPDVIAAYLGTTGASEAPGTLTAGG